MHTHQNLLVPVEWGCARSVLHAACLLLDPSSIPFHLSLCMGSRKALCFSVCGFCHFFIIAHCQNVVSPHTSLLAVSLWNLCWKMKAKPSLLATKKAEGSFWHVHGLWRHRDHTGDEEENIWVERSHLFLWLEHSLPSCRLWEVYLLKEHLPSCLPKPALCHLNACVIQSCAIFPGNTSTSSVDKDTQICFIVLQISADRKTLLAPT